MSYPVVAECWTIFESALLVQARKLVDDIAKHQKTDAKTLWAKVKPTIRIPLLDVDLPDQSLCIHVVQRDCSPIYQRCRAPCLIGFNECTQHINSSVTEMPGYQSVDRIVDYEGVAYFVDESSVARDSQGVAKGMVENDTLFLFEKK